MIFFSHYDGFYASKENKKEIDEVETNLVNAEKHP